MNSKTIISLLLSVVIALSFFPGPAFAQGSSDTNVSTSEEAYEPSLLEHAAESIEDMGISEDRKGDLGIIDAAYRIATSSFSDDVEGAVVSEFTEALLKRFGVDSVLISGFDGDGNETAWIIVRFEGSGLYYVLYPKADIGAGDGARKAYLVGADYLEGWTPEDSALIEGFAEAHPLSETKYVAEDTENTEGESEEVVSEEEAAVEEEPASNEDAVVREDAEAREEAVDRNSAPTKSGASGNLTFGASEYTYASGTCGHHATWTITTPDWSTFTLRIDGSGPMSNYASSNNQPWKSYNWRINKIVIGANITAIGDYAFYSLSNLTSVQFKGKKVNTIGNRSFYWCPMLEKVSLPSGLNSINDYAFAYCYNLSKVNFPASLVSIGQYAFYYDSMLTKVTIGSNVRYLDDYSLYYCSDVYYRGTRTGWGNINGPNAVSSNTRVHFSQHINKAKITFKKPYYVYTTKAIKASPIVKIKVNGSWKTLRKGKDYKLSYKNNVKAGKATVTITGINDYYGKVSRKFTIAKRSIAKAKVIGVKNRSYTGKKVKLSLVVKVKIGKKYVTLKKGRDYTVKYKNNKKLTKGKKKAQVTIIGKGNYKGKIIRKFKIVKGSPGLKFKNKKLSRTATLGGFKNKVTKKAKGKFVYTYTSSKPSVATVNKKTGKITPKKVGTTTITVKTKATKYFRAGKASFKLTIRPLKYGEMYYNFENYCTNRIPLSTFRLFYNPAQAKAHYRNDSGIGSFGVCFGMSTSSTLQKMYGTAIKPKYFKKGAKNPSVLSKGNKYKSGSVTLKNVIEAMHLSQNSPACQKQFSKNFNRLGSMVKEVKTGNPVIIGIYTWWGGGGHAIVGYKIKKISKTKVRMYTYDCNFPGEETYIELTKNKKGKYTGWYYYADYCSPGVITYVSARSYRNIWKNRKAANKLSQVYVSTDSFQIKDSEGTVVAEMKDGKFTSSNKDIYLAQRFGAEADNHLVCMPTCDYEIVNTAADEESFEITSIDENQSIVVDTTSESIVIETNEEKGINTATIEPGKGDDYTVTVIDGTEGTSEADEIVISGEGTGQQVTLGKEDGDLVTDNAKNVQVDINGEAQ